MKHDFPGVVTKSSIMVGLGESEAELDDAMRELRGVGVDILTWASTSGLRPGTSL